MTKTTNFVWDPLSDCVLTELDGTNTVQAVYTNEPQQYGGVLSQRRGTTTSTYHADALGTTRALTDSTQTTTDTYLYDAWGNLISSTGTIVNPFRWVGRYGYYQDASTGLVYVRARMYQPKLARWCSRDPLEFVDSHQLYSYARLSPLSVFDSSGQSPGQIVVLVIGLCTVPPGIIGLAQQHGGPLRDKFFHCMVSCWIARNCGAAISLCAGIGWEIITLDAGGGWKKDIEADLEGLECAGFETVCPCAGFVTRWFRTSCRDCCNAKYPEKKNAALHTV